MISLCVRLIPYDKFVRSAEPFYKMLHSWPTSCFLLQTGESREIYHFHYTTWPDFGVPESPASFLNFLFKVRESGSLGPEEGPSVVHCSAGIGRSGTFALVDTCLVLVRINTVSVQGKCCQLFKLKNKELKVQSTIVIQYTMPNSADLVTVHWLSFLCVHTL